MEASVSTKRTMAHLPLVRFTSIATAVLAIDSLVCVALWLAGGDSLYLEDSVEEFSFTHSTFDLACLAFTRGIIIIGCLYYLETFSVRALSVSKQTDKKSSRHTALFCQAVMLIVSFVSLVYAIVKGILILVEITDGQWNKDVDPELHMSIPYMILCILAIIFPALDICVGLVSLWCVNRMFRVQKIRLIINETEDGEGNSDTSPKQNASLKRIFLLAKPVSLTDISKLVYSFDKVLFVVVFKTCESL